MLSPSSERHWPLLLALLLYLYRFRFQKDGSDTEEQQKDAAMMPMSLLYLFVFVVPCNGKISQNVLALSQGSHYFHTVTMFARCFARSLWTATPTAVCQGAADVFFATGPKPNWHRWVTGIALQMAVSLVGSVGKQMIHITSEKDFQLL